MGLTVVTLNRLLVNMPSRTASPPLTVTVLAALWVGLARCGVLGSSGPGCDNGKLYLDNDLPVDAVYWDCPLSARPKSNQRLTSIDTVYDPEPGRQICMDKSISYNHPIPNSGAYRPVGAESGEYLYCPPQRWLNNLHHAATVLLFHPCAPPSERLLLSVLARSCLSDYIITLHPQLRKHMPVALVSWGRTLELSSVASLDVCDWLETTSSTRTDPGGVNPSRTYNLLLTRPAKQHPDVPEEHATNMKDSLRRCCEQTISSLLNGFMESSVKKESLKQMKEEVKSRQKRAAIRKQQENVIDERENTVTHVSSSLSNQTKETTTSRTGDAQSYNSKLAPSGDSSPGNRTLSDPPDTRKTPSQSDNHNINEGLTPRPTTTLGSNMSETLRTNSVGQTAAQQPSLQQPALRNPNPPAGLDDPTDGVNSEHNNTAEPETANHSSKDEGTERNPKGKLSDKDSTADGVTQNKVVDVKERELEPKQTHSDTHSHHKSDKNGKNGFDYVSKSQSKSPPQQLSNPQPASRPSSSHDCEGCRAGEHCECNKDSETEAQAAVLNKGLPRTPRTDEAVWAAAALGFLLVLLTLSVLHTRLYRHWRTPPSLYWHDPQQEYDSVADVIRRRLRIAKRRRKRGRRQECVLLPSSSSSDEHP